MTHVSFGRKNGILALISLLVLVSLLFTSASVQAQEVDMSGFDLVGEFNTTLDWYDTVTFPTTTENNENFENPIQFECEIDGHKYDQNGNPLSDWQIGLMKIVTQDEKIDIWDLSEDVTDIDGYYCLEWDGENRILRGDNPTITDVPYDFSYHVYEKLVDNWNILSIEKGTDISNLSVVNGSDIRYDGSYVSTKIGETNGYIYANTAYHVDFYNIKSEEEVSIVGSVGSGGSSSGGGTRVDRQGRGGGGSSNTEPKVLGEATSTMPLIVGDQVTMVPTGAPDTGAGGTSSNHSLSFSQILYISRQGY